MSDLLELLRRDPLNYTKDGTEIKAIVQFYRDRRKQFELGNMNAGKVKAPTQKDAALLKAGPQLDLKGLI